MTNYEDVPGAAAAERGLRARQYAALQLIAILTGDVDMVEANLASYRKAGLTLDVVAAQAELVRLYMPVDTITELRRMVEPVVDPPEGPGPDAENHSVGTVDDCPGDGLDWPVP